MFFSRNEKAKKNGNCSQVCLVVFFGVFSRKERYCIYLGSLCETLMPNFAVVAVAVAAVAVAVAVAAGVVVVVVVVAAAVVSICAIWRRQNTSTKGINFRECISKASKLFQVIRRLLTNAYRSDGGGNHTVDWWLSRTTWDVCRDNEKLFICRISEPSVGEVFGAQRCAPRRSPEEKLLGVGFLYETAFLQYGRISHQATICQIPWGSANEWAMSLWGISLCQMFEKTSSFFQVTLNGSPGRTWMYVFKHDFLMTVLSKNLRFPENGPMTTLKRNHFKGKDNLSPRIFQGIC